VVTSRQPCGADRAGGGEVPSPAPARSCEWGARFFAQRSASAWRRPVGSPQGKWRQRTCFVRRRSMHGGSRAGTLRCRADVRVVPGRCGARTRRGRSSARTVASRATSPYHTTRSVPRSATGRANSAWRWAKRHPARPSPGSEIATRASGGQAAARRDSSSSALASRRAPSHAQQRPSCGLTKRRRRSSSPAARRMVGVVPWPATVRAMCQPSKS
jgi:hypothetical protein